MNKKDRLLFAFITVLITVPCFVTYCLSIENHGILNVSIKNILVLIAIEFVLAFLSEIFIGSPLSFKIANKALNDKKVEPFIFETMIICSTVLVMFPLMSFLATILYKGIFPAIIFKNTNFSIVLFFKYFIPNFLQTVVLNFHLYYLVNYFLYNH